MVTEIEEGQAGSTLDEFLAEEGILDEAAGRAVASVLAWLIERGAEAREHPATTTMGGAEADRASSDADAP